jgi:hemerythrin-like domain-containing protein
MIPIQLGGKPLADFAQPIEMLKNCHRRIEHFFEVLERAVEQFGDSPLSEEQQRAVEGALDYFRHAAPNHTADEENSLFPRMRRSRHPAVRAALAELNRLEADHRRAEVLHARIEDAGRRWLESGRLAPTDRDLLRGWLDELATAYAAHIRLEDERVFALALQALDADELREVGQEMQRRRAPAPQGVSPTISPKSP